MQPFDADRKAGPGQNDKQEESHNPDHQPGAGETEQVVDVEAAEPDQRSRDEAGPDGGVDQHGQPVSAAVDPAREAEKQRRPVHGIPLPILGIDYATKSIGTYQSRNNSLMLVLARVRSSTRLTITAQAVDGPASPFFKGRP